MVTDFGKLDGTRGFLKSEDIEHGEQGDCDRCPVALALMRMFPSYEVNVDPNEITVHRDGVPAVRMLHSEKLGEWIDAFDNECEVDPVTLIIHTVNRDGYQYEVALLEETLVDLRIRAAIEPIPQGDADDPEFQTWCKERNIMIIGGCRRGWYGTLNSYLNDAAYVVSPEDTESGTPFLMTKKEYQKSVVGASLLAAVEKKSPQQRLTEILTDFAEQVDTEEWKYVPTRVENTIGLILDAFGIPQSEKDTE